MIIYYIFSIGFLLTGTYLIVFDLLKKNRCTIITSAKIIDFSYVVKEETERKNKNNPFRIIYQYEANKKNMIVNGIRSYSKETKFYKGEEVELFYNPKKISEYYTKNESRIIPGIIICVISVIFLLTALL